MGVIWKIAFRNLREHKIKTLIVGMIISIGITVLVVGNSLMDTATAGIKRNYIENYTGHIIITGEHSAALSLFGSDSRDEAVPVLPDFAKVVEYAASLPDVEAYSPQAVGQATISVKDEMRGFALLFGVDPAAYLKLFPANIEMVAGEFLKPGEKGIVLSERIVKQMADDKHPPVKPGDTILLTGMSMTGGTRIREMEVRGIFRFINSDPQLNMVSLIDITNLRALAGMNVQAVTDLHLNDKEEALLGTVDEESLFGGDDDSLFGGALFSEGETVRRAQSEAALLDILGTGGAQQTAESDDASTWHFLLLKLKNPAQTARVQAQLQEYFAKEGIAASVQGWLEGAGAMAKMTSGIKTVFNIIVLIVAVVAVIIIMNTLVISVTERIAEIGTMRAIGAQRSFVRQMITLETIAISGVFGLLGLLAGGVILFVLNLTGLHAPNIFFRILFGGEVLRPILSPGSVVVSLLMVTAIGVLASWYPVSVALKIQPVRAMQGS